MLKKRLNRDTVYYICPLQVEQLIVNKNSVLNAVGDRQNYHKRITSPSKILKLRYSEVDAKNLLLWCKNEPLTVIQGVNVITCNVTSNINIALCLLLESVSVKTVQDPGSLVLSVI